jgi:serine/threonine protein kinase
MEWSRKRSLRVTISTHNRFITGRTWKIQVMVRRADELFLAIAVKNELLEKGSARGILDELKNLDAQGTPRKARHLCLEKGFLSNKLAKKVKMLVMEQLATEQQSRKKTRKNIGAYKLGKQLSASRLGVLYRAQTKSGTPVLLKVLGEPLIPLDSSGRRDYFKNLKQVQKLNHMSLIPLLDCGEDKETAYAVFEDVTGEALSKKIRQKKLLDERGATRLALALCEVLKEAAEMGVLHGNLNPTMVIYDEGGPRVRDLGVMPSGVKTRSLEEAAYRAPEALIGQPFDLRADIYGLGAMLYASVSGRMPFENVDAIRFDPLTPLSQLNPSLSSGFCQLVEAMLSRKPEQRYQNYEALVSDLDNVIAGFTPALELGAFGGGPQSSRGSSKGGRGRLKTPTRRGPAVDREDRVAPRKRRDRDGDEERIKKTSSILPVVALGVAALVFVGAIFLLGGKKKPKNNGKTGPVVVKNNDNDTNEDYLEKAAQKAYDQAITFKYWDRLEKFEDLINNYGKTRVAARVKKEAETLRRNLVAEENKNYAKAKLRVDGLQAGGEWIKAIAEFEVLVGSLHGEKLKTAAGKELETLKKNRLAQLKGINTEAGRLARSRNYQRAILVLKESMGLRDEPDRKTTRVKITALEGKRAAYLAEQNTILRAKHEKAIRGFESTLKDSGSKRAFDKILKEGTAILAGLDEDSEKDLIRRVDLHVRAAKGLKQIGNMVSYAALDLVGKELEIQQVKGSKLKGRLIEVDGEGGLILEIRGGEITVTRNKVSLATQEFILLKANKSNSKGLMLIGLCWIYSQSDVSTGLKKLRKAQKKGSEEAAYYLAAKKDFERIFGESNVTEPEPTPVKDPVTKKEPVKEKKPDVEPVTATELYDNLRVFYTSASEVGFNNSRTDAIYDFFSGAKALNPKDWDIRGRNIYTNAERQAVVLEKSGSVFHQAVMSKDFTMSLRLSYTNSLVKRSAIRLVIIDQKKKEEYRALFGQQLYHYKKGRLRRREGLAIISQDLLKPKTIHKLEIGYKNGEVWTKLNGEQHGFIKGAGISKARLGITWDKMSINLHSVRIEGFLDDEWARKRIDDKNKKDKKKRR